MKIFLKNQTDKFSEHFEALKSVHVMKYKKSELKEKVSFIPVNVRSDIHNLQLDFFFNYKIFPENILNFQTQWQVEGRSMRIGDTILQQVFLPPTQMLSQKIIFGVRICDMIDAKDKIGFSYETLY